MPPITRRRPNLTFPNIQSRRRSHTTTATVIMIKVRVITAAMIPATAPALSCDDDSSWCVASENRYTIYKEDANIISFSFPVFFLLLLLLLLLSLSLSLSPPSLPPSLSLSLSLYTGIKTPLIATVGDHVRELTTTELCKIWIT